MSMMNQLLVSNGVGDWVGNFLNVEHLVFIDEIKIGKGFKG